MNAPAIINKAMRMPSATAVDGQIAPLVQAEQALSVLGTPTQNTSNNPEKHWRMPEAQIGAANIIPQQTPLVFKFSEADVAGAGPWLNKLRIINFSRFAATASTGFSGFKEKSSLRFWGAIVGTYSNIINIVFGSKKGAIAGTLQMAAGEWKDEGEWKTQAIQGKMPNEILAEVEEILNDSKVPPKSVQIDSTPKGASIKIKSNYFDQIQSHLHQKLYARQAALNVLHDTNRMTLGTAEGLVSAISLSGLSENAIKEVESVLEREWRVPVYVTQDSGQASVLHIPPESQARFAEKNKTLTENNISSITVRRKYESPSGVFEAILRPDKYPFQNGLLVGGILANAMRIYAGLKGDELSQYQPIKKEIEGSVISMLAYFIEAQREISVQKDLYAPTTRKSDEGEINNLANKTFGILNERPLLAAAPMKAWMIINRAQDALTKKLDKKTGQLRRDDWKVVGTSFDALSAILTATMQKSDYGG